MLASLLAQIAPYGNVASCGLAGSPVLDATVMPFIIRGVSLLGIASAGTARDLRDAGLVAAGRRTGSRPRWTPSAPVKSAWTALPEVFPLMLAGHSFGRTVVENREPRLRHMAFTRHTITQLRGGPQWHAS